MYCKLSLEMVFSEYYLLQADLQDALQSGCLNNSNKIISKDNKGLYLVVFKVLNNKKKSFRF